MGNLYDTLHWRELRARALARDCSRCTVSRLLGGECSGVLHVHHIEPADERPALAFELDNLATACAGHHARWEALRRALVRERRRGYRRCPHPHPTRAGREACERRLNAEALTA
jgi:hypothetical protein